MSILDDPRIAALFGMAPVPPVKADATDVAFPRLAISAAEAARKASKSQRKFSADSASLVAPNVASNLSQADREHIAAIPKHATSGRALALTSLDDLDQDEDDLDAKRRDAKKATPPSLRRGQ